MIKNAKLKSKSKKNPYAPNSNLKAKSNTYQCREYPSQNKCQSKSKAKPCSSRKNRKQSVLSKIFDTKLQTSKTYICYSEAQNRHENSFINNRELIKKTNPISLINRTVCYSSFTDRFSFLNKVAQIYEKIVQQSKEKGCKNAQLGSSLPSFIEYFLGAALYQLRRHGILTMTKEIFEKLCLQIYHKVEEEDLKNFMLQPLTFNSQVSIIRNSRVAQFIQKQRSLKASSIKQQSDHNGSKTSTLSSFINSRRNTGSFDRTSSRRKSDFDHYHQVSEAAQKILSETFRNSRGKNDKENSFVGLNILQGENGKSYFHNLQRKTFINEHEAQSSTLQRIQHKLNAYLGKVGNSIPKRFD